MFNKHIGFDLQATLNAKHKPFDPRKPEPKQLSVPPSKEGSDAWCRAIAEKSKKS